MYKILGENVKSRGLTLTFDVFSLFLNEFDEKSLNNICEYQKVLKLKLEIKRNAWF